VRPLFLFAMACVITGLSLLCLIGQLKIIRSERFLNNATNTGIMEWQGAKYHVIPWEGNTP
jgi:hypothetical protein